MRPNSSLARRDSLQRAVYRELREKYGLSANLAVRAIARIGKRKRHKAGGFKATSVDYNQRILSVSLGTAEGRAAADTAPPPASTQEGDQC